MKTLHFVSSFTAVLALAVFSGCATSGPTIKSSPDATVAFENYRTFAMILRSPLPVAASADVTPGLAREVRTNVKAAFVSRGLTEVPDRAADLLILVHGGIQNKVDVAEWSGPRLRGRNYDIEQYKEGTILIDVFDARTRDIVWRGSVVNEVADTPKPEKIKAAIDAVVARYPN